MRMGYSCWWVRNEDAIYIGVIISLLRTNGLIKWPILLFALAFLRCNNGNKPTRARSTAGGEGGEGESARESARAGESDGRPPPSLPSHHPHLPHTRNLDPPPTPSPQQPPPSPEDLAGLGCLDGCLTLRIFFGLACFIVWLFRGRGWSRGAGVAFWLLRSLQGRPQRHCRFWCRLGTAVVAFGCWFSLFLCLKPRCECKWEGCPGSPSDQVRGKC